MNCQAANTPLQLNSKWVGRLRSKSKQHKLINNFALVSILMSVIGSRLQNQNKTVMIHDKLCTTPMKPEIKTNYSYITNDGKY